LSTGLIVALVAAIPPTLAAILAFASSRSVKRSVGPTNGVPLSRMVEILDGKIERQARDMSVLGERQAKLEERLYWHLVGGAEPR
jgi:hypothetical protein